MTRVGKCLLAAVALCLVGAAWVALGRHEDGAAAVRGEALFQGAIVFPGRLAGHEQALPTTATRCVNCHGRADDVAAIARAASNTGWSASLVRTAPALGQATLAMARSRRGGPPSAYDAAALCRLLRDGIDPAQIVIAGAMPRYAATDAQCADLWAKLSRQP
ncbi:MAG: hypothetical protein JWQ88_3880 [Rhodoferax sp.]|nr:hypothetical protein [Rhodoferax sp.]